MIKKILATGLLGLVLIILVPGTEARGQEVPAPREPGRLRQNLFTLRALRMTQVLELTELQTAAIFPELNRAEKDKAELQKQLAAEIRNLRDLLNSGKAKDEELEARTRKVKELRMKIQERDQIFEDFLFNQLTPMQRAKYIIFNLDFNRVIMERAHRLRQAGQKIK